MIKKEDVYKIGVIGKPHGVKGELNFTFTDDSFDREEVDYLIFLLEGIFVPFFIESYRFRSDDTAIIKFEDIYTADRAKMYSNVDVYLPLKYADESDEIPSWSFFEGFQVIDEQHGELGIVSHVDDTTLNTLFVVEKEGDEMLIPANEAFITNLDRKKRILYVAIPEGLLD